jgi:hypothetical protein
LKQFFCHNFYDNGYGFHVKHPLPDSLDTPKNKLIGKTDDQIFAEKTLSWHNLYKNSFTSKSKTKWFRKLDMRLSQYVSNVVVKEKTNTIKFLS